MMPPGSEFSERLILWPPAGLTRSFIGIVLVVLAVWVLGHDADGTAREPSRRGLPLLSYQVPSLKQGDHELPGLQFGLQFTAVRPSPPGYGHGV